MERRAGDVALPILVIEVIDGYNGVREADAVVGRVLERSAWSSVCFVCI